MAVDPRLAGLSQIAGLMREIRLAQLQRAEAERQALLDRLATLTAPVPMPEDLPPAVGAEVVLRYQRWAELRRREVKAALQTAGQACEKARAEARAAVGRDENVTRLQDRAK